MRSIVAPKATKLEIYWNYYRNTLQTGDRNMVQALQKTITLEEFLQLPETKPASEYINGAIEQKPMPQGKHSTIQGRLVTVANHLAQKPQIALALLELRCTFGGCSIVPDVAIFAWNRIPLDVDGEIADTFNTHPDWTIEILSPGQSQTKVTNNIQSQDENYNL